MCYGFEIIVVVVERLCLMMDVCVVVKCFIFFYMMFKLENGDKGEGSVCVINCSLIYNEGG